MQLSKLQFFSVIGVAVAVVALAAWWFMFKPVGGGPDNGATQIDHLSTDAQFASWMKGRWQEVISKGHNFQYLVTFDGAELRVTHDRTEPDPERPVSTSTTRIAQVRVNDKQQWVVSVAWSEESSSRGFQGKRVEPSDRVYSFWPVSEDLVWFDNAQPGSWKKLRRSK